MSAPRSGAIDGFVASWWSSRKIAFRRTTHSSHRPHMCEIDQMVKASRRRMPRPHRIDSLRIRIDKASPARRRHPPRSVDGVPPTDAAVQCADRAIMQSPRAGAMPCLPGVRRIPKHRAVERLPAKALTVEGFRGPAWLDVPTLVRRPAWCRPGTSEFFTRRTITAVAVAVLVAAGAGIFTAVPAAAEDMPATVSWHGIKACGRARRTATPASR